MAAFGDALSPVDPAYDTARSGPAGPPGTGSLFHLEVGRDAEGLQHSVAFSPWYTLVTMLSGTDSAPLLNRSLIRSAVSGETWSTEARMA
jgi:hypothetical protein